MTKKKKKNYKKVFGKETHMDISLGRKGGSPSDEGGGRSIS